MRIVLLGAPGAGKGTQASMICEKLNIPHVSTGDIFRKNIKEQTPIGIVAKGYIDKGELVPDEVVAEIVRLRLLEPDCKRGYLLDGFPRTVTQAEILTNFSEIDVAIDVAVPTEKLLARITGRRVCESCAESYHVNFLGDNRLCPKCGGKLIHREDDTEEIVKERLAVYKEKTEPLIDYYTEMGVLVSVNGDQPAKDVLREILEVLK